MTSTNTQSPATTSWRLDPDRSNAEFRVPTLWGLATVRGGFYRLAGALDTDRSGRRTVRLSIDAASLSTGNRRRDEHLRSADFFDCERHPEVRFTSTSVEDAGDGRLRVAGELEAAGERVALEVEPELRPVGDGLEVTAEAVVDQRQLGMTVRRMGIRSPARLSVRARLLPAG